MGLSKIGTNVYELHFNTTRAAEKFERSYNDPVSFKERSRICRYIVEKLDDLKEYKSLYTIDELNYVIQRMLSHLNSNNISSADMKRLSNMPCPNRRKYPYANKFYAMFYN